MMRPDMHTPSRITARLAGLFLFAALLLAGAPARAEPVYPPGQQWGLTPPPGFTPATGIVGFMHPSGAVIIVVTSVKPHDRATMAKVGTVVQGNNGFSMRVDGYEDVTVGGLPATIMTGTSVGDGTKLISMMPQGQTAGMIMAMVPEKASPPVDMAALRTALFSARERALDVRTQLDALPVKVGDIDGMRIAGTVGNLGFILTDGPQPSMAAGPDQSFAMLVAVPSSMGTTWIPGKHDQAFLKQLATDMDGVTGVSARSREIGGQNTIEAFYEKRHNGQMRFGVAFVRPVGDHNVLLLLDAPVGGRPDVARMERIFTSIAVKK